MGEEAPASFVAAGRGWVLSRLIGLVQFCVSSVCCCKCKKTLWGVLLSGTARVHLFPVPKLGTTSGGPWGP